MLVLAPAKVLSIVSLGAYYFTDDSWTCPPIRESFSVQGGQPPYWITTVYADTTSQVYPIVISVVGDLHEPLRDQNWLPQYLKIGMNISFAVEDSNHNKAYTSALVVRKGNRENCKKEFWDDTKVAVAIGLLAGLFWVCLFSFLCGILPVLPGWYERRALAKREKAKREKLRLEQIEQRRQSQVVIAKIATQPNKKSIEAKEEVNKIGRKKDDEEALLIEV